MRRFFSNGNFTSVCIITILLPLVLCLSTTGYVKVSLVESPNSNSWLHQFGSNDEDQALAVAVDSQGNAYVAGFTRGSLPGQASSGSYDAFVRKYDKSGTELWTRQFGTSSSDVARGIATDSQGSAYVVGYTSGTLPGQASSGSYDAFLRKYDRSGTELWTHQFGSITYDRVWAVAVDNQGNAYVVGSTNGTLPGQTSSGWHDAFVRKYDKSGTELWTHQFGTMRDDYAWSVAVDNRGNAYVTGYTSGTLPGQTSSGLNDAFVCKYDKSGNELWTCQFGTSDFDEAWGVAVDNRGEAYVAGYTNGTLPGQTSSGHFDAFVGKYDKSGNELWTCQFGTSSSDVARGIATDSQGSAYVVGYTSGALLGQSHLGNGDAFVRKYDRSGSELWTCQFGTNYYDNAWNVAVDNRGNAYVVGYTYGTLPGQTSSGHFDAFVCKFNRLAN